MRNILALIAGGATWGASFALFPKLGFGPTEIKILPFVFGVIVWFSIKQAGKKKDDSDSKTA